MGLLPWGHTIGIGPGEEAVTTLRKAIQLRPDYLPARLKLAQALLAAGRFRESRKVYEELIQQKPESALAHYGLGRVQSAQGQALAAVESYLRACQLSPGFAVAHYALGITYRNLGERAKSQEHLSLFREGKPGELEMDDPLLEELEPDEEVHFKRRAKIATCGSPPGGRSGV